MSSTASTPPDGTAAQRPTLADAVVHLADGQDALGDALGEVARDVAGIDEGIGNLATELTGAIRGFGDAHGHRAAAERHVAQQLALLVGQGKEILQRLTRIESRTAGAEMELQGVRERVEALEALAILAPPPDPPEKNGGHDGE